MLKKKKKNVDTYAINCSHHELRYEFLAVSKMDLFCHQFHVGSFWPTECKKNTISSNEVEKTIYYDSKMNIGTVTLVFVL